MCLSVVQTYCTSITSVSPTYLLASGCVDPLLAALISDACCVKDNMVCGSGGVCCNDNNGDNVCRDDGSGSLMCLAQEPACAGVGYLCEDEGEAGDNTCCKNCGLECQLTGCVLRLLACALPCLAFS